MPSAELKLYQLASGNPTLQTDLGTSPFRWFDRQLVQGALAMPPTPEALGYSAVRVRRISTIRRYIQGNGTYTAGSPATIQPPRALSPLSQPRFQIDVLDFYAETARQVAADVIQFLMSISLASDNQFASPVTMPPNFPCIVLSQRAGMDFQLSKKPAYVESIDCRLFNLEELP